MQVFNAIDRRTRGDGKGRGDGRLTIDDFRDVYAASKENEMIKTGSSEGDVIKSMMECFEGSKGNHDGMVTLEEWLGYYEELSASIESDDYFAQMIVGAWTNLFDPSQGGELKPPVMSSKVDVIEKKLIEAIRTRSSGASETRKLEQVFKSFNIEPLTLPEPKPLTRVRTTPTLSSLPRTEPNRSPSPLTLTAHPHRSPSPLTLTAHPAQVFKSFDIDGSGAVSFEEFRLAMERFGLSTGGEENVSGCTTEIMLALFERYDPDGSGELSYLEFIRGLFKENTPASLRAKGPGSPSKAAPEQVTSWTLPSELGGSTRPGTAGMSARGEVSYARGRGGMMGGMLNLGVPKAGTSGQDAHGGRSAAVNGFNRSSGIFR